MRKFKFNAHVRIQNESLDIPFYLSGKMDIDLTLVTNLVIIVINPKILMRNQTKMMILTGLPNGDPKG